MIIDSAYINVGPFRDSHATLQDFVFGLYYTHCFDVTLKEMLKIEQEYQDAVERCDSKAMAAKQEEIAYYENMILLATTIRETWDTNLINS